MEYGLNFFDDYLHSNEKFEPSGGGKLKMTVICIHNSIEILLKKILSNVNDLLIYKNISDSILRAINKYNSFRELHEFLITTDSEVHTIDFSECIKRIKAIYDIDNHYYKYLDEIGRLRNKVTHFGIDRLIDFYQVIGVINKCLEFIDTFIFEQLSEKELDEYSYLVSFLSDTKEYAEYVEEDYWGAYYSEELVYLNKCVDNIVEDVELNHRGEVSITLNKSKHIDSRNFSFNIRRSGNTLFILSSLNIPEHNITLIIDDCFLCYGFIDHSDNFFKEKKHICVFNNPVSMDPDITPDYLVIKKENKYEKKELNIKEIRKIIMASIELER